VIVLLCAVGIFRSCSQQGNPPPATPPKPATKLRIEGDRSTYFGMRVSLGDDELARYVGMGDHIVERSEPFPEEADAYTVELSNLDGPLKANISITRVKDEVRLRVLPTTLGSLELYIDGRGASGELKVGKLTLPSVEKLHRQVIRVPEPKTAAGRELALGDESLGQLPEEEKYRMGFIIDAGGGHTYDLQEVVYMGKGGRVPHDTAKITLQGARCYEIPIDRGFDLSFTYKVHFLKKAPDKIDVSNSDLTVESRTKGIKHLQILSE